MKTLIKKIPLENGLTVFIYDHTRRYYEDFHLVKLEMTCEVSVNREYFTVEKEFAEARYLLGEKAVYRRFAEQMGVASTGIEHARELLIQNFTVNSLPYFSSSHFPEKFVLSQYEKAKQRLRRTSV